jgi:hypothetical protein
MVGYAVDFDESVPINGCYTVQLKDESVSPVARPNQFVLVCPERDVESGDLVVVDLRGGDKEGEWLFWRYYKEGRYNHCTSVNTSLDLPAIIRTWSPEWQKSWAWSSRSRGLFKEEFP